jgi:hypothetical protein
MGKMKAIHYAVEEAIEQGLMPDPADKQKVWVLTCDGNVFGVYVSEDTAKFDMHMCQEADEWENTQPHEYKVTKAVIQHEFWSGV